MQELIDFGLNMISIITTAINRPTILQQTMDSLFANSDILKHQVQWIIHIDYIAHLGRESLNETVALCNSYKSKLPVIQVLRERPQGPAQAINECARFVKGETIFYLEDDWLCHHGRGTATKKAVDDKLEIGYFLDRLKTYAYCTLAARLERCSFNPCLIRSAHYLRVTKDLDIKTDAEMQAQHRWMAEEKTLKKQWLFDPEPKKYFSDLGREWLETTQLKKWDMKKRYNKPVTYTIESK